MAHGCDIAQPGVLCLFMGAQVGNQDRGYQLELMLTKVRYSTAAVDENCSSGNGIQIVGMSATLSNASDLAQWLSARLYQSNFRPIELQRHVKVLHLLRRLHCLGMRCGAVAQSVADADQPVQLGCRNCHGGSSIVH